MNFIEFHNVLCIIFHHPVFELKSNGCTEAIRSKLVCPNIFTIKRIKNGLFLDDHQQLHSLITKNKLKYQNLPN